MSILAYKVGRCLLQVRLNNTHTSQQELAHKLGITKQQVNKYVLNKQKMSIETAGNIAFILRCHIDDLYEWIEAGDNR